jgi:hypothetical protein
MVIDGGNDSLFGICAADVVTGFEGTLLGGDAPGLS